MGLSTLCARRRPRPQAGHGFSYAVNSSFPHPKINLVVSADLRAGIIESTAKGLRTKQDAPSEILICNSKLDYLIDRDVQ